MNSPSPALERGADHQQRAHDDGGSRSDLLASLHGQSFVALSSAVPPADAAGARSAPPTSPTLAATCETGNPEKALPVSRSLASRYARTFSVAASKLIHSAVIVVFRAGVTMRSVYEEKIARASKNARTIVQGDARLCSPIFGKVCKVIWPFKTAEELAARTGCSVRAAAYELSGEREPSVHSLQAVINAIIPQRG